MKHAKDPTRIPEVLAELQRTWEGQPDLPLATLFGVLANRGVGWGTPDEELVEALRAEQLAHPGEILRDINGRSVQPVVIETYSPDHKVTLSGTTVVVRSLLDRDRPPSAWEYTGVRPTGPGRPLVVTDGEGIDHRLGVVGLLRGVDEQVEPNGLKRADLGNLAWLIETDTEKILLTHRIHLWRVEGRETTKTAHAWNQVVRCQSGEKFVYAPAGGGAEVTLGRVERVLLLES